MFVFFDKLNKWKLQFSSELSKLNFVFLGDPQNDANAEGDAFKTLFVGRIVSAGRSGFKMTFFKTCLNLLGAFKNQDIYWLFC